MPHLQRLESARVLCNTTGQCNEYEAQLHEAIRPFEIQSADDIQLALIRGWIIGGVGLIVVLIPLLKPLRAFQRVTGPKLAIAAPVAIGLLIGGYYGFVVSFCIWSCSIFNYLALFVIPLGTLIVTIPWARKIQQRQQLGAKRGVQKPVAWVLCGLAILLFSIVFTLNSIDDSKAKLESQRQRLSSSTH